MKASLDLEKTGILMNHCSKKISGKVTNNGIIEGKSV
jgi:hypothetical protein